MNPMGAPAQHRTIRLRVALQVAAAVIVAVGLLGWSLGH
jgi:hypothetical protein